MYNVLIIDDDKRICGVLGKLITRMGHRVATANELEEGLQKSRDHEYDLILLDIQFPNANGLSILPELCSLNSAPEIIIITGSGVKGAELAFKHGVWDYIKKPFTAKEISYCISRALQYRQEKLAARKPVPLNRSGIIGSSAAITDCLNAVAHAAALDASVLITGDTGTGKELFARAVHENSKRKSKNFVVVDCGSLSETLAESILFGYKKGAFTGAEKNRSGLLELADEGTLFLDEIGELSYPLQKAFLRALQEKRIRPLGSPHEVPVNFRVVAATNRDLPAMVENGSFRQDLLFRLKAIEIELPALSERGEDIQEIAVQKIHHLCQLYDMGLKGISQEFLDILSMQRWPGNVRELINVLEHSLAAAGFEPTLIPKHIPYQYRAAIFVHESPYRNKEMCFVQESKTEMDELPSLSEFQDKNQKQYLNVLMKKVQGDMRKATQISGISRSQLYALLKKHDLDRWNSWSGGSDQAATYW